MSIDTCGKHVAYSKYHILRSWHLQATWSRHFAHATTVTLVKSAHLHGDQYFFNQRTPNFDRFPNSIKISLLGRWHIVNCNVIN